MSSQAQKDLQTVSHTPGPWRREPTSTNIATDSDNVGCVSADYHLALVFADGGIGKECAEANARLIAAAPDMLAALCETTLQLLYLADKFGETGTGAAVLARVNTVIAKATGVKP